MTERVLISYDVSDGYVGKRSHSFAITVETFEGMSQSEIEAELADAISEHFSQHVSWSADLPKLADKIVGELERIAERADGLPTDETGGSVSRPK